VNYYGVIRVCNSLLSQLSSDAKVIIRNLYLDIGSHFKSRQTKFIE